MDDNRPYKGYSVNNIKNYNININNNDNSRYSRDGIAPFTASDDINIFMLNRRIFTTNGLLLVDSNRTVVQVLDDALVEFDRWDIVGSTIRNVGTGRYMTLQQNSTSVGVPIITTDGVSSLSNWTIRNQPQQPILPPPPVRSFIFNDVSRRPIEVPNNTANPGQAILQGRLTSGNLAGQSFTIL